MELMAIKKGKDFRREYIMSDPVTDEPFDPTGWSIRASIKAHPDLPTYLYEWPVDDLILDEGKATVLVPASVSSGWSWTLGYYDIEIYNGTSTGEVDKGRVYADFEISTQ